ncbi:MAG: nucleotidyltransferase family protein [Propionibacteriaceae bacterium]|nr:nucleotidyltransferase family protein [Propionibacteriaceae bacterium]
MSVADELEPLPLAVAIRFSHAVAQSVADTHGIDLLHIKGPAVPEELLAPVVASAGAPGGRAERQSHDADVLVRPGQTGDFIRAIAEAGWTLLHGFEDDSVFAHAATLHHDALGFLDLHRCLPGMDLDPERAFDALFAERTEQVIAGQRCAVPSVTGQRLILILNAGRSETGVRHPDLEHAWAAAAPTEREQVAALARSVSADAALAAITGQGLRGGDADFRLWRLLSQGEERSIRFAVALVRAQPTLAGRLRTVARLGRVARRRLAGDPRRPGSRRSER